MTYGHGHVLNAEVEWRVMLSKEISLLDSIITPEGEILNESIAELMMEYQPSIVKVGNSEMENN